MWLRKISLLSQQNTLASKPKRNTVVWNKGMPVGKLFLYFGIWTSEGFSYCFIIMQNKFLRKKNKLQKQNVQFEWWSQMNTNRVHSTILILLIFHTPSLWRLGRPRPLTWVWSFRWMYIKSLHANFQVSASLSSKKVLMFFQKSAIFQQL